MYSHWKTLKFFIVLLAALFAISPAELRAQATLLLEEPYSYDGTFAGTGHSAVYLSRICAETPTQLRRCRPGETGVVLSRYHRVAGLDWIAVPLIAYLYAVKNSEDIPLLADSKLVALLRNQYLQSIAFTGASASQLAGSAYDRTTFAFRIATRPEQDEVLIRLLNGAPNQESYRLLNRNCADFAKQIINFYYPRAIHRSVIADLGVMTPKQAAKSLVRSSKHHPEMHLTTFIIPQVPGLKRSKPVHGVMESVVLAKKYVAPVLLFHPFVVGTVEAAYWAAWRFNPGKDALIFNPSRGPAGGLELPLTTAQYRSYQSSLLALLQADAEGGVVPEWRKLQAGAEPQLDVNGQPFLRMQMGGQPLQVGICRSNAFRLSAPPEMVQGMLLTRLDQQLKQQKPSRISRMQMESDWKLLERAVEARQAALISRP